MNSKITFLVWDLPVRLFHWLFTFFFALSAGAIYLFEHNNTALVYHALFGLIVGFMVLLRIVWGVIGTKHAKFSSFAFPVSDVLKYFFGVLTGTGKNHAGHNPGSAYAIFAMLILSLGLAVTGIMMGRGYDDLKHFHEFLSNAMMLIVFGHIIGVLIHTKRFKENITASMIHGMKETDPEQSINSSKPIIALIFLALIAAWTWGIFTNYDSASKTTTLPMLGAVISLDGENERGEGGWYRGNDDWGHDDDDDDDD